MESVLVVTADDALRGALEGAARAAWPGSRVLGAAVAADTGGPAVILLDLGPGTAAWHGVVRAHRGVAVVGVGDLAAPETMLDAEALGVAAFVRAPVEPATLAAVWSRLGQGAPGGER